MKHLMLDVYGVKKDLSGTITTNEIINEIIRELSLKAVMPPVNIPYYYCLVAEDGGVSTICLLDCGHITMHTFPFYGNCFIDIMFEEIDEDRVKPLFERLLEPEKMNMWFFDRDTEDCPADYNPQRDFGPHLLVKATADHDLNLDRVYDILETLPKKVDMNPIIRPIVVKNRVEDYNIISGIIIIAESHISCHYNKQTGVVYFDLYSCRFFPPEKLYQTIAEIFPNEIRCQLISRGLKQEKVICESYSLSDNGWRSNI